LSRPSIEERWPLLEYILRRLLYFIPISLGVTVLVFGLVHIAPGDPLNAVVGADAPAAVVEKLKKDYGFDKPLPVQYVFWLGRALTGDLGLSVVNNQPVVEALAVAVPGWSASSRAVKSCGRPGGTWTSMRSASRWSRTTPAPT